MFEMLLAGLTANIWSAFCAVGCVIDENSVRLPIWIKLIIIFSTGFPQANFIQIG